MKQYLKKQFVEKATYLAAIFIFAFSINANAQKQFTLSGKVLDGVNPLPGASVVIKGTTTGTTTGAEGNFSFTLKKGTYTLLVSAISEPKEVTVILSKNTSITIDLADSFVSLDEVLVSAVRVKAGAPVTFNNVTKEEFKDRNLGQDIPILLNYLPSVVTTSDAGAGVGYTGIRVRGSDATRVNITINGIPYNDPESQGTYWVNMPDFASSTESMQLQRGVGTSTNGSGAFGASLNLLTDAVSNEAYGEVSASFGSYNTQKYNVKFSTGLMNDHIEFSGRLSKIDSDGYIDNAWSDLKSYFLQGSYVDDNTLIKAITFGGEEQTYQAWAGVTKEEMEEFGRTYNPYTYDNEIDNYKQNHYQLLWNETISENWSTNIAFNYTKGEGYFEQYKEDQDFADYNLDPIEIGGETIDETDLIRRRWLDNDNYVVNANATYNKEKYELIFGGSYSNYTGDHYGEIIWAEYASNSQIREPYYGSETKKNDGNIFAKLNYKLNPNWHLFIDIQERFVSFKSSGTTSDGVPLIVDENYAFFNPKAGITYQIDGNNSLYFSYARANREPNRVDYENGITNPELLNDIELGWRLNHETFKINSNIYYMLYKDQLVLTGAIDDTGSPIRATSGKSYRLGLEIDAYVKISNKFNIQPNMAFSSNKNVDFTTSIDGELVDLGNTNIAFSPDFVAGSNFVYQPIPNLQFALLSKFVGEQYMSNTDSENSKLDSYFVNDLNVSFEINPNKIAESIQFNLLVNNIFDVKYISNGYYYTYDDDWSVPGEITTLDGAGYYPQATINFLLGATVRF
jgi:iron complex outermembrane receptor protein